MKRKILILAPFGTGNRCALEAERPREPRRQGPAAREDARPPWKPGAGGSREGN